MDFKRNNTDGIDKVILDNNNVKKANVVLLKRGFLTKLACKITSQNG